MTKQMIIGARLRRTHIIRDLIVIAAGSGLLVFGLVSDSGLASYVGGLLIVICAIGLRMHLRTRPPAQVWTRRTRTVLSVIGLVLGVCGLVWACATIGWLGQRATGVVTDCRYVPTLNTGRQYISAHDECKVAVIWPDGTHGTYVVGIGRRGNGTAVTLYQAYGPLKYLVQTGVQPSWQDGVAYLVAGFILLGQAVLSLAVLASGDGRRKVTSGGEAASP